VKLLALSALLVAANVAHANTAPGEVTGVDIVEKLGDQVPSDLTFTDQTGKQVQLGSLMKGKPTIVAMVYYSCPQLCGQMLMALHKTMKQLDWKVGKDYDVVTVSIDPNETSELAAKKRQGYLQSLDEVGAKDAMPFLVGNEANIAKLADSLGYKFKYVQGERQFAHIAALFVLSPQGKVARYLYGIDFPTKQVKLALFEAADGRVGTSFERTMLRCYKYDPASRRYELFITRYFRATGVALLLLVGGMLSALWRKDLKRNSHLVRRA
jgi:protein SCO1/2